MQTPDAPSLNLAHATLLSGNALAALGAPPPANEDDRLAALHSYNILDTAPEPLYDDITAAAAQLCRTPMALISLIDQNRQWFKSRVGMQPAETPRDLAFCAHAILQPDQMMEVGDTSVDPRFARNALVTGGPQIRFYAGAPLLTSDGVALGTLCVLDRAPRTLSDAERTALQALARQVVTTIELRQAARLLEGDALRDPLTDLWNREGLEHVLEDAAPVAKQHGLAFVLIEIDGFKRLKLQFGSDAADATLVQAARCIETEPQEPGGVARIGAAHFCMVLPGADSAQALASVQRLQTTIAAASWPADTISITAGLVCVAPGEPVDSHVLMARARHALLGAARAGRNCVQRFDGWQTDR
ncbi:sensor domain-containing diguanylate cyclase [Xanthomonas campestris pv. raphani]|uniref:GGDEF domain-containing protein n=1 Tax=Xanthomonas campestris TaxID=339 RepID=UPI002368A348|nr:sensor domain-containing diguanylate cyclase [Xanthomonas campestris]MEA9825241.1 sensor domain-containing diguanylate cyclase [Xanthomonas campestris pv. raphani]MEA9850622.1 sensor domain-containing diguanylate cyclase [Xanthomonas campestris pv. raphani]MEA9854795.1 sensor domain-containing diguanylate cyclase [Xanthomonas campestris pv. raphani]MEA9964089.1 sensor domain-containing diguanylate cyclase [Xanthomonas campestris pv. raphani]WDJ24089.1 sensor domain-containing diguanylate cy